MFLISGYFHLCYLHFISLFFPSPFDYFKMQNTYKNIGTVVIVAVAAAATTIAVFKLLERKSDRNKEIKSMLHLSKFNWKHLFRCVCSFFFLSRCFFFFFLFKLSYCFFYCVCFSHSIKFVVSIKSSFRIGSERQR